MINNIITESFMPGWTETVTRVSLNGEFVGASSESLDKEFKDAILNFPKLKPIHDNLIAMVNNKIIVPLYSTGSTIKSIYDKINEYLDNDSTEPKTFGFFSLRVNKMFIHVTPQSNIYGQLVDNHILDNVIIHELVHYISHNNFKRFNREYKPMYVKFYVGFFDSLLRGIPDKTINRLSTIWVKFLSAFNSMLTRKKVNEDLFYNHMNNFFNIFENAIAKSNPQDSNYNVTALKKFERMVGDVFNDKMYKANKNIALEYLYNGYSSLGNSNPATYAYQELYTLDEIAAIMSEHESFNISSLKKYL